MTAGCLDAVGNDAAEFDSHVESFGRRGLRGRRSECEALDEIVASARRGEGRVLVVRGEPGVGKTALLDYLAARAHGCRVVRVSGVESEMQLAFAGLHQLCAPFLHRIERLADPQRDALETAFGLRDAANPDRFLVSLAVLGLMSGMAEERPLICTVDDAQWLDRESTQTLAFVIRHLVAEPVAVVFTPGGTTTAVVSQGCQSLWSADSARATLELCSDP